jgi:hypothetical protein
MTQTSCFRSCRPLGLSFLALSLTGIRQWAKPTIREGFWGDISKSWSIYYAGYKKDIANLQQNYLADKLAHLNLRAR